MVSYIQKFVKDFAKYTGPLFNLLKRKHTKQNKPIKLDAKHLKLYNDLKTQLSTTPVLKIADFEKDFELKTDASKCAIGAVLFQTTNGIERPIAYASRKMIPSELNYPTQQQELLAIVWALNQFRVYCLDKPVVIHTDHRTLENVVTQKMANRRLARWYDILAEYQPIIRYIKEEDNEITDALSRISKYEPTDKHFHELVSFNHNYINDSNSNRNNSIINHINKIKILGNQNITEWMHKAVKTDKKYKEILTSVQQRDNNNNDKKNTKQFSQYFLDNQLLYYQTTHDLYPRLVIPNDKDI